MAKITYEESIRKQNERNAMEENNRKLAEINQQIRRLEHYSNRPANIEERYLADLEFEYDENCKKLLRLLKDKRISYQKYCDEISILSKQFEDSKAKAPEALSKVKKVNSRPPKLIQSHLAAILEHEREKERQSPIYKLTQPVVVKIAFKYFRDENGDRFTNQGSFRSEMSQAYIYNETEHTKVKKRLAAYAIEIKELALNKAARKTTINNPKTPKPRTKPKT